MSFCIMCNNKVICIFGVDSSDDTFLTREGAQHIEIIVDFSLVRKVSSGVDISNIQKAMS